MWPDRSALHGWLRFWQNLLVHAGRRYLRSDNVPDFVSQALLRWVKEQVIELALIYPGKPWQKGTTESFNGKFRDECMAMKWFHNRLEAKVIIDASLVQVLVQRNKREEADTVKEGTMPLAWKVHKRAQKDVDSRWTKKHGKNHFGYKLPASVDKRCKLIRKMAVSHAAVADTTVFEVLLDRTNASRDVYADRGYPSAERE